MNIPSVKETFQRQVGKVRLEELSNLLSTPLIHEAFHAARASMTQRPGITNDHYQGVIWFLEALYDLVEEPQPPPRKDKHLLYGKLTSSNTAVRA